MKEKDQIMSASLSVTKQSLSVKTESPQDDDFTYWYFLKESGCFSVAFMVQKLISVIVFAMYGLSSNAHLSGQVYYVVTFLNLISSGIRDFQKPISIICGPYLSKGDFYTYQRYRNQMILLNTLCYLAFVLTYFFLRPLYRLSGIKEENLESLMFQSLLYVAVYKPLITVSNFQKGIIGIRQLQSTLPMVGFVSLVLGVIAGYLLIFVYDLAIYGFMGAYAVKYVVEIVAFSYILYQDPLPLSASIPLSSYLEDLKYIISVCASNGVFLLIRNLQYQVLYLFVLTFPNQTVALGLNASYLIVISFNYYIGLSFASYTRVMVSHYIGLRNVPMIKKVIVKSIQFSFLTSIVPALLIFVLRNQLAAIFMNGVVVQSLLAQTFILALFQIPLTFSIVVVISLFM